MSRWDQSRGRQAARQKAISLFCPPATSISSALPSRTLPNRTLVSNLPGSPEPFFRRRNSHSGGCNSHKVMPSQAFRRPLAAARHDVHNGSRLCENAKPISRQSHTLRFVRPQSKSIEATTAKLTVDYASRADGERFHTASVESGTSMRIDKSGWTFPRKCLAPAMSRRPLLLPSRESMRPPCAY